MRWLFVLVLLALPRAAPALTDPIQGPWVDLGAGVTVEGRVPPAIGPGWTIAGGWFFGRYDDVFAIGRYTGVGLAVRQAWLRDALETVPSLHLRRGVDALVLGYHGFLTAGPVIRADGSVPGVEALAGLGVKYRFRARLGIGIQFGMGARIGDELAARGVARVVLAWTTPLSRSSEAR